MRLRRRLYDETGARAEKTRTGYGAAVIESRRYVDASYEVDVVGGTHQVHLFVGMRRVATARRSGLGTAADPGATQDVLFYHPDLVGSNTVLSDAAGQVVQETFLTPFGQVHAMLDGQGQPVAPGATATPYLFTDQERDAHTGLDDFGARSYDPIVGRFLSQDPELMGTPGGRALAGISAEPQLGSPYAYALNRPTSVIDPDGRLPYWVGGSVGAVTTTVNLETGRYVDSGDVEWPAAPPGVGTLGAAGGGAKAAGPAVTAAGTAPTGTHQTTDSGASQSDFIDSRFEPPGSRGAFGPEDQARIRDVSNFVGERTDLAQEFGGGRLEDPVRFIRDPDLKYPGAYDFNGREHVIYLRPDALRHPGNLRSIVGHELHHAYGTQFDTFGLDALAERAANAWELRNASQLGVHPRYLDQTRILYEWYR